MGGSNFDAILQEISRHQRIMEQLEEENQELRRQIADLREGQGIYLEICGKRFALRAQPTAPMRPIPAPTQLSYSTPTTKVSTTGVLPSQNASASYEAEPDVTDAPTIAMPETPPSTPKPVEEDEEEALTPSFLEEIMIDEFANASTATTSPMATWSPPAKKQQRTDEDEKEALRRQLIGSFLLE